MSIRSIVQAVTVAGLVVGASGCPTSPNPVACANMNSPCGPGLWCKSSGGASMCGPVEDGGSGDTEKPADTGMPSTDTGLPPLDMGPPPRTCPVDACVLNSMECGPGGGVRVCVMMADCPAWGPESACPAPMTCQRNGSAASCCGDGMRTGAEKCDGGRSTSTELGACNPECSGFYEKKLIRQTQQGYSGNLGGPSGADQSCQREFGGDAWKALIVGGARRATRTPLRADDQADWVIKKYTHYYNANDQFLWRTDDVALLGVRDGRRMNIYAKAFEITQYPWGGYDTDWTTQPEQDSATGGTCQGWTSSNVDHGGGFPLDDLTRAAGEPCSKLMPLLCVQQ